MSTPDVGMRILSLDGDFRVPGTDCRYYCSPTCHPCQVGPEWQYGCSYYKHPRHVPNDWVPLGVQCGGNLSQCECKQPPKKRAKTTS